MSELRLVPIEAIINHSPPDQRRIGVVIIIALWLIGCS